MNNNKFIFVKFLVFDVGLNNKYILFFIVLLEKNLIFKKKLIWGIIISMFKILYKNCKRELFCDFRFIFSTMSLWHVHFSLHFFPLAVEKKL